MPTINWLKVILNLGTPYLIPSIEAKATGFRVLAGKKAGKSRHFHFWQSFKIWFSEPLLILAPKKAFQGFMVSRCQASRGAKVASERGLQGFKVSWLQGRSRVEMLPLALTCSGIIVDKKYTECQEKND
jgi:hypothetical protein